MNISETESGWIISFSEAVVSALQIDFRFGLIVEDNDGSASVVIEVPFHLAIHENGNEELVPSQPMSLASALGLFNASVSEISASKSGKLHIAFVDGASIEVEYDGDYESWQVSCTGGFMIVCEPGGHVSCFKLR